MEPPIHNNNDDCFVDALERFSLSRLHSHPRSSTFHVNSALSEPLPDTSFSGLPSPAKFNFSPYNQRILRRFVFDQITAIIDDPETRSREKRLKLHRDLKGNEKNLKSIASPRPIPHRVDSSAVGVFGRRRRRRNRWWRRRATIELVTRSTQRVSPICVDFLSAGRKTLATKSHHRHFKIQKRAYLHFIEFLSRLHLLLLATNLNPRLWH